MVSACLGPSGNILMAFWRWLARTSMLGNKLTIIRSTSALRRICDPPRLCRSGGRALLGVCLGIAIGWVGGNVPALAAQNGHMTEDEALRLGEEFGVIVGEVDEEIRKELKMQRAQGVAVFEVIGNSRADYAGIKVRSVIKEIDKAEIRNLLDFGNALKRAIKECNFTVGTYEPADPSDPIQWGVNFHFVGCRRD